MDFEARLFAGSAVPVSAPVNRARAYVANTQKRAIRVFAQTPHMRMHALRHCRALGGCTSEHKSLHSKVAAHRQQHEHAGEEHADAEVGQQHERQQLAPAHLHAVELRTQRTGC